MIELRKAGLEAETQTPITVYYDGEAVGEFIADILVNGVVNLELKSVRRVIKAHEIQLVNYLVATNKDVGLLLTFGEQKVPVCQQAVKLRRKVRVYLTAYPNINQSEKQDVFLIKLILSATADPPLEDYPV